MSKLVEELKKEHSVIAEILNNVKSLGIASEQGQKTLLAAKNVFLAHLKKEDEQLYLVLNNAAESDVNLKWTLDMYAKDMEGISKAALEFFEKYSTGGSGIKFAEDYGSFVAKLSQRIRKEENIIYAKYDELKL
jgi:hypothetical protein